MEVKTLRALFAPPHGGTRKRLYGAAYRVTRPCEYTLLTDETCEATNDRGGGASARPPPERVRYCLVCIRGTEFSGFEINEDGRLRTRATLNRRAFRGLPVTHLADTAVYSNH